MLNSELINHMRLSIDYDTICSTEVLYAVYSLVKITLTLHAVFPSKAVKIVTITNKATIRIYTPNHQFVPQFRLIYVRGFRRNWTCPMPSHYYLFSLILSSIGKKILRNLLFFPFSCGNVSFSNTAHILFLPYSQVSFN